MISYADVVDSAFNKKWKSARMTRSVIAHLGGVLPHRGNSRAHLSLLREKLCFILKYKIQIVSLRNDRSFFLSKETLFYIRMNEWKKTDGCWYALRLCGEWMQRGVVMMPLSGGIFAFVQQWIYAALVWVGAFGCLVAAFNFKNRKGE